MMLGVMRDVKLRNELARQVIDGPRRRPYRVVLRGQSSTRRVELTRGNHHEVRPASLHRLEQVERPEGIHTQAGLGELARRHARRIECRQMTYTGGLAEIFDWPDVTASVPVADAKPVVRAECRRVAAG